MTCTILLTLLLAGLVGCRTQKVPEAAPVDPDVQYAHQHNCKRVESEYVKAGVVVQNGHEQIADGHWMTEYECPDGVFIHVDTDTEQP